MPGKQFTSEQIITIFREAEVLLSQGQTVIEAVKKLVADLSLDNAILKEVLSKKS